MRKTSTAAPAKPKARAKAKAAPKPRKSAGPSIHRLNQDDVTKAMQAAKVGCTQLSVATHLGVSLATFLRWLRVADEPLESPRDADACLRLATLYRKALADGELSLGATAFVGATGGAPVTTPDRTKPSPRLALDILARRCPERWGLQTKQQLELSGADGESFGVQVFLPTLLGDDTHDGKRSR